MSPNTQMLAETRHSMLSCRDKAINIWISIAIENNTIQTNTFFFDLR
jgi:hypothetical protein